MYTYNPDVIIGTESKLDATIPTSEVFPQGFHIARKDRKLGGGGVFVAASENLLFRERDDLTSESESCWAEIQTNSEPLLIGAFYRPPGTTVEALHQLDTSLTKINTNSKPKHILLGGDFNVPQVDWSNHTINQSWIREHPHCRADNDIADTLLNIADNHALTQLQDKPTRHDSILDLVFTTHPDSLVTSVTIPDISIRSFLDAMLYPRFTVPVHFCD